MKKVELIKIWKDKYNLDSKTVNQVLEFVFNLSKENVFLLEEIDPVYIGQIIFIFEKLLTWYPLAYIIKKAHFMWLEFYVNDNVLIPRDDTEILVKEAINELRKTQFNTPDTQLVLIDIWTWSWIIPINIAKNIDLKEIYALDISDKALEVAKENIYRYNLEDKIELINIDFKKFDFGIFKWKDLIVTANLPYVKDGDKNNMDFSVFQFEPSIALYGWKETWFELYEDLVNILIKKRSLFKSLVLFIEIGFDQYEISKNFLTKKWLKFEFFKDTNKILRVIKIIL